MAHHAKPPPGSMPLGMDHVPKGLDYRLEEGHDAEKTVHTGHGPTCAVAACTKAPSYGFESTGGKFCYSHRRPGMVFIRGTDKKGSLGEKYQVPHGLDYGPSGARGASGTPSKPQNPSKSVETSASSSPVPTAAVAAEGVAETSHSTDASPLPDLLSAKAAIQVVKDKNEDPTVGLKYLSFVLKHPDELKYRTMKRSNPKFSSEVWLNAGMRGVFQAIGFHEVTTSISGAVERHVVLNPLHPDAIPIITSVVKALSSPNPGGSGPQTW